MSLLYNLGMHFLYVLIAIASTFNSKAKLWIKGRKGLFRKLKSDIDDKDNIVWFHCASLGEFEQGRPVIEEIKKRNPDYKILLTFYSPSGYEIRKNYEQADFVYYLPLDIPKNAKRFLQIVKPKMVFFVKYEFWYHFLKEINRNDIPLFLISGIFRKNQRFFNRRANKSREMLGFFTHFFVQNTNSAELLKSVGFKNVTITGDTRFDRVYEIAQQAKELKLVKLFISDKLTLVVGSSWKPDEELLIKYFNEKQHDFKMIIAPHEIHKENIKRIENSFAETVSVLKYSEANETNVLTAGVLIIDCIGLLSSIYRYGDLAYIGGGFGKGIHNTLEAATFGLPVIFGPNYLKFQEAVDLVQCGAAFSINSYNNLQELLNKLLTDKYHIRKLGEKASAYITSNCGATQAIMQELNL